MSDLNLPPGEADRAEPDVVDDPILGDHPPPEDGRRGAAGARPDPGLGDPATVAEARFPPD